MIEVHENTSETITMSVLGDGVPIDVGDTEVVFTNSEGEIVLIDEPEVTSDFEYRVIIPFSVTKELGRVDAIWTAEVDGEPYQQLHQIDVIRPYVTIQRAREDDRLKNASFEELKYMERVVRGVIDGFCQQSFYPEYDVEYRIPGADTSHLVLPRRMMRLNSFHANGFDLAEFVRLQDEGFSIQYNKEFPDNIVFTSSAWRGTRRMFSSNIDYVVRGDFGWDRVPKEVGLSAYTLIGDYFEHESEWRRRNVDVIRAADWRMEFAGKPIHTTGNVDVDIMLAAYVYVGADVL